MVRLFFIALLCFTSVACSANEVKHKELDIHGFKIMVSKEIIKNRATYHRLIDQLDKELKAITEVVPLFSLNLIRETPIWFEKYLPPPLTNRGFFNNAKSMSKKHNIEYTYGGIVFSSPSYYLNGVGMHPWTLLHELAHAYHKDVAGHNNSSILNAYENAKKSGLYLLASQYALRNHREFFSELTESYFGLNNRYPANRKELAEHDPMGYCAIVRAWGLFGNQPKTDTIQCK